jgi:phosphonopyruvate decarboxylase
MTFVTDADILTSYIEAGIQELVTVPCTVTDSWLRLAYAEPSIQVVATAHEGNLVGIACGRYLGTGVPSLVHMQNSGLPNAGDGFISFASRDVFDIPIAVLVTYRGWADIDNSEPHQAIGKRTDALVQAVFADGPTIVGSRSGSTIESDLASIRQAIQQGRTNVLKLSPAAFKKTSTVETYPESTPPTVAKGARDNDHSISLVGIHPPKLTRDEAIADILSTHPRAAVLFCNGYMARGAQAKHDRLGNFYNVGYMGGTLALGWGLARSRPDLNVVVVDGDQNAQMSAMRGQLEHHYPENLHWYVLDNNVGASVGGAPSLALPSEIYRLARVLPILPEGPSTFACPRVKGQGVYHNVYPDLPPTLAGLAQGFRRWVSKQ